MALERMRCQRLPWRGGARGFASTWMVVLQMLGGWAAAGAAGPSRVPVISVEDARVEEGAHGEERSLVFRIRLSSPVTEDSTVTYEVFAGTATGGVDFAARTGRLTFIHFGASGLEHQLNVPVFGDDLIEPNETVSIRLTQPEQVALGRATAIGVILNDDGPALSILPASVVEGDEGPVDLTFPVVLSHPSEVSVSASFYTVNLTARNGEDFESRTGWLTFAPGETQRTITIPVLPDLRDEPDETFLVQLTAPSGATLLRAQAVGTIVDNDTPVLSVSEVSVVEGTGTPGSATFQVRLDPPSPYEVRVNFRTEPLTASAGDDFVSHEGILVLVPGQSVSELEVEILGDDLDEADEEFLVRFSSPVNAVLPADHARGIIRDDDAPPFLRVEDTQVFECEREPEPGVARFVLRLSHPSGRTLAVPFASRPGSAEPGEDYEPVSGVLEWAAGSVESSIPVPVMCDDQLELEEYFELQIGPLDGAWITRETARARIADANPPAILVEDLARPEGDAGTSAWSVAVSLSSPSMESVSVEYTTHDGTAIAHEDYQPVNGRLWFPPGVVVQTFEVRVFGDPDPEADERFEIRFEGAVNARISRDRVTATVLDDDRPDVVVEDLVVVEGGEGARTVGLPIHLSDSSGRPIALRYAAVSGTALEGEDFRMTGSEVLIPAGVMSVMIPMEILGDQEAEGEEEFEIHFEPPAEATLARESVRVTVVDDDSLPVVSAADVSVAEGDAGQIEVPVVFEMTAPRPDPVVLVYATAGDTAKPALDYVSQGGEIVFAAGETNRLVRLVVLGDMLREPDERFFLVLRASTNAALARNRVVVTLEDDDTVGVGIEDASVVVSDEAGGEAIVVLHLSEPAEEIVTLRYATRAGSASAVEDFETVSGTATFLPGETEIGVTVSVRANSSQEGEEVFYVELSDPVGAVLRRVRAAVQIVPKNPPNRPPSVRLTSPADGAEVPVEVPIVITALAEDPESRLAGVDFIVDGTVLERRVAEPLVFEWPEASPGVHTILARAEDSGGLSSTSAPVVISVLPLPVLAVEGGTVSEADGVARIPMVLSRSSPRPVSVRARTIPGSAREGRDFVALAEAVVFAPGERQRVLELALVDDGVHEAPKALSVEFHDPAGATLSQRDITLTLLDDDPPPELAIAGGSVVEGNMGSATITFEVTLAPPSDLAADVAYASRDQTAQAGADYLPVSGILRFAPGETRGAIEVQVIGDGELEDDETFEVVLSSPREALLGVAVAKGIVVNDDREVARTNQLPIVEWVRPATRSLFRPGETAVMEATATDPDGWIRRVDFVAGETLLGSVTSPPYLFTWDEVPLGDHTLVARAMDDEGAVVETPAARIAVTDVCGRAALIASGEDPEIGVLLDDLFVLGISSQLWSPLDASAEGLAGFDLVIWHDVGIPGPGDREVELFRHLAASGTALYFVGDGLLSSLPGLSAAARETWLDLIRLRPLAGNGPPASDVEVESGGDDPVVGAVLRAGKVGSIGGFTYSLKGPQGVEAGGDGETVLARAGDATVMVATEGITETGVGSRRIAQTFRVADGEDARSREERRRLFQNAVWWLLNCQRCDNLNLVALGSTWPEPASTGESLTIAIQVLLSGGCEALSVSVSCVLPEGARFVEAVSGRGNWDIVDGHVRFYLGRLPRGTEANMQVTVVPGVPGLHKAIVSVRSLNESVAATGDNDLTVLVGVGGGPRLTWERLPPSFIPEWYLLGRDGARYGIESSPTVLGPWNPWVEVTAEPAGTRLLAVPPAGVAGRYLRIRADGESFQRAVVTAR